jgi:hypothetical protein
MMQPLEVIVDFYGDWIQMLREKLVAESYTVDANESPFEVCKKYFNVQKRKITRKPRKVLISREFKCPPEYQAAVNTIIDRAEKGEDLIPYLSTLLLDADYNDSLLNDWDIHHFHLSNLPHPRYPQFVERTAPLLFARVTDDCFYLIAVMKHGDWTNKQLLEILHANWPDSLQSYRIRDISPSGYSEDDIREFRKHNIMTFIELHDGTIYAPLGRGYATSGMSIEVVQCCDYVKTCIDELEEYVKQNAAQLVEQAYSQHRIVIGPQLSFRLEALSIKDDTITAQLVEQNSGVKFTISPTS